MEKEKNKSREKQKMESEDQFRLLRINFAKMLKDYREYVPESSINTISLVEGWILSLPITTADDRDELKELCLDIYKKEIDNLNSKIEKERETRQHIQQSGRLLADLILNGFGGNLNTDYS